MKKSLLALAVLGAFTGVASAQSSVTLYGTLDVNGRYVKADGQPRRLSEATDGINSSQLGFRGVEDLGNGLKGSFNLLAGVNADSGTSNVATTPNNAAAAGAATAATIPAAGNALNNQSKFWNRRATVSLLGNFGEVRLGRDYIPAFWNETIFDAFGTNGLGNTLNVRQMYGGTRQDNAIGYFLPSNLGGFYGQIMVGAAEGGSTLDRPGRHLGARLGFAAGAFDIAVGAGHQRFTVTQAQGSFASAQTGTNNVVTALNGDTQKTYNIGGSWNFGALKLLGYFDRETLRGYRESMGTISAVIPFGQNEIHVGYDRSKLDPASGPSTSVDQIKATYQYNLSKRTAVYATVSRLDNKDATRLTLPGASAQTSVLGGVSTGAEFGLRHFF
jgi:predicted porin